MSRSKAREKRRKRESDRDFLDCANSFANHSSRRKQAKGFTQPDSQTDRQTDTLREGKQTARGLDRGSEIILCCQEASRRAWVYPCAVPGSTHFTTVHKLLFALILHDGPSACAVQSGHEPLGESRAQSKS